MHQLSAECVFIASTLRHSGFITYRKHFAAYKAVKLINTQLNNHNPPLPPQLLLSTCMDFCSFVQILKSLHKFRRCWTKAGSSSHDAVCRLRTVVNSFSNICSRILVDMGWIYLAAILGAAIKYICKEAERSPYDTIMLSKVEGVTTLFWNLAQ